MYRARLASGNPATVWFRPVRGPLEPVPGPALKPLDEVERIMIAELVARAPRPRLKPVLPAAPARVIPAEYQSHDQSAPVPLPKPPDPLRLAAELPVPVPKPAPAS